MHVVTRGGESRDMSRVTATSVISDRGKWEAQMTQELAHAGIVAIFGMLIALMPLGVAVAYMIRPTERRLGLMRPLSLAAIFAALHTFLSGVGAELRYVAKVGFGPGFDLGQFMHAFGETITPLFVAAGLLTAAWLCVAAGMRRQA